MKIESNLKSRIKVAVPGAFVFFILVFFMGQFGAVLITAILSSLMLWEFGSIVFENEDFSEKRMIIAGMGWLLPFISFWLPSIEFSMLTIYFIALLIYFLYTAERFNGEFLKKHFQELTLALFGVFYISFLMNYLIDLRGVAKGQHWTFLFFLIIWSLDSGAYFVGLKYGKNKLYPHLSPKKSWEGFFGGMGVAIIVTLIYKLIFFKALSLFAVVFVPLILGVFGPIGDLAESFLKRAYDKKDSGTLLFGHGGFLDRFDSVVLGVPVMYALTRIFGVLE